MSTFIHGGSGLELDVGARAHAALSRGDVVGIDTLNTATNDGQSTCAIGNLNTRAQQAMVYGVVLGSNGKSTFAVGEDVLLRVIGVCDAAVSATTTSLPTGATQVGILNAAGPANNLVPTAEGGYSAPAAGNKIVAVIQETRTGALCRVWFNGLGVWG
mgnify:CR=1 FL=1